MTTSQHIPAETLSAHVDDDLSPEEQNEVNRHVASCHACWTLLEELRETRALLNHTPRQEAPKQFTESVDNRIRYRSGGRFFAVQIGEKRSSYVLFIGLAAVLLALFLLFDLLVREGPDGPDDRVHPGADVGGNDAGSSRE